MSEEINLFHFIPLFGLFISQILLLLFMNFIHPFIHPTSHLIDKLPDSKIILGSLRSLIKFYFFKKMNRSKFSTIPNYNFKKTEHDEMTARFDIKESLQALGFIAHKIHRA